MRFRRSLLSIAAIFLCVVACREVPTPVGPVDPVDNDDPILKVTVPGAYGVESGNEVLTEGMQTSLLEYPEGTSWRLIHPSSLKVVSFSGLPSSFAKGDKVSFLYRVSERGITRAHHRFTDVEVLQVTDSLIWLKQNEHTFFVLQP